MIPEVGTTCAFTFQPKFATLNGVYRIRTELMFIDAIASGIDFVGKLYTPAGLSQANFNTDYSLYLEDRVAVLESVSDTSVIYYTPESIFLTIPDPTINEYYPLIMVVNLGVQQNTQVVLPVIDQVKDTIQSLLGSTNAVRIVTNPQNKVYLTDAEYQTLVAARVANMKELVPLSVQVANLQTQNTYLAAKVAAYEALLAAQASEQ